MQASRSLKPVIRSVLKVVVLKCESFESAISDLVYVSGVIEPARSSQISMSAVSAARKRRDLAGSLAPELLTFAAADGRRFSLNVTSSTELTTKLRRWIFGLFCRNMEQLYRNSDWGFKPKQKSRELFASSSRYIVALQATESRDRSEIPDPVAYVHFRFVHMDTPARDVLYCYEIQLEPTVRRLGLGSHLISVLETVAQQTRMQALVATIFKNNSNSLAFFSQCGFTVDVTSPSCHGNKSACYEIFSRSVTTTGEVVDHTAVQSDRGRKRKLSNNV